MRQPMKAVLISLLILLTNCKSSHISFNQSKYIGLRWGTLGVIENKTINFYEVKQNQWDAADIPEFKIPKNDGLLFVGLGKIGIINNGKIKFYSISSEDEEWKDDEYPDFSIPDNHKVISVGLGIIGVQEKEKINFFQVKNNNWIAINHKISSFKIPPKARLTTLMLNPLGIESIGAIVNHKLQLYHYNTVTKKWELSDLDFSIPTDHEIVSIGFGVIGLATDNSVHFLPLEIYINERIVRKDKADIPSYKKDK